MDGDRLRMGDRNGTRERRGQGPAIDAALFEPAHWRPQLAQLLARVRESGVLCDEGSEERLALYCTELAGHSKHVNLISRRETPLIVAKHVSPSLGIFLVETPAPGESWMDIGSGGGFPGMVLKLCRPKMRIALLDSSEKKAAFLERVRERLQLTDLEVICARAELYLERRTPSAARVAPHLPAVILMRAVAPLARSFRLVGGLSAPGTRLLTYKGPAWERELVAAEPETRRLGWRFVSMTPVPWGAARVLKFEKS